MIGEFFEIGLWQIHSTRAIFFISGLGAASWAPLVPLLRDRLEIGESVLGLLLLCIGIGSLLTMPISGAVARHFGCRKALTVAGVVFAALLLFLSDVSSLELAVPAMLLFGASLGCIDVVVNIQAVLVEKSAERRLMSGMYAFWSVGAFLGAGLFGLWVGIMDFTPFQSTLVAFGIMLAVLAVFYRHLLPFGGKEGGTVLAIPRGVVVFVGTVAFISFLVEGAIMDWSGVFLIVVRGLDVSLAGSGFAVFSAAMLIMRLLGDRTVQKLGQKSVALGGSALAFAGFLLLILAESLPLLYAGFFLIGIGIANIVPIFFSLLGKQTAMPISTAVPAVSTMGFLGILMGPAAIGFLAHHMSLYTAFGFLAALVAFQAVVACYVYKSFYGYHSSAFEGMAAMEQI